MAIRNIRTLEDCAAALRELDDFKSRWESGNIDFSGRRIINAGHSEKDNDYVIRAELRDFVSAPVERQLRVGGSGGGRQFDIRTFGFAIAVNLTTGTNLLPPLLIPFTRCTLSKVYAKCKVAPTGSSAIADINLAGVSILGATKVVIPVGSTSPITPLDTFDTSAFVENDELTFDCDQIGSTIPGQTLVVTMKFIVNAL